jgi:hypothetical protein
MFVDQDFILENHSNSKLSAVIGPPGSGKTHILEQIAVKHAENCLNGKILILCVQNSACDSLLKRMKNSFPGTHDIMRLNSQHHQKLITNTDYEQFCIMKLLKDSLEGRNNLIDEDIQIKYLDLTQKLESFNSELYELQAKRKKTDDDIMDMKNRKAMIKDTKRTLKSIENKSFTKIVKERVKVIVSTACTVYQLPSDLNFSIVLFDEAAYATPLHIFMAAVVVNHECGKMILFGDIKQLGKSIFRKMFLDLMNSIVNFNFLQNHSTWIL